MQRATAGHGYITDIPYVNHFHRFLAPGLIRFSLLNAGFGPPPGADFRYLELGIGRGLTICLLAAAHPESHFVGIDLNPAQVAEARALADAAGLTNLDLRVGDFAALGDTGAAPFDFVVLHGILSWVSEEVRHGLWALLPRLLAPSGVVYASYNLLPGWASVMPLRRLMQLRLGEGRADPDRIAEIAREVHAFAALNPAGLPPTPTLTAALRRFAVPDPSYIAHEYLNGSLIPFYFADVNAELEGIGLRFAGQVCSEAPLAELALSPALRDELSGGTDRLDRETRADFATGATFRRDLYVASAAPALSPEQREIALDAVEMVALLPAAQIRRRMAAHALAERMPQDVFAANPARA